eukprot:scaffold138945_cov36-Cyclotella_meneghiniana.AAC.2
MIRWRAVLPAARLMLAEAIYQLGSEYSHGTNGLPLDHVKAYELFLHAVELGHARAHNRLAIAYFLGKGVQVDTKKATHHYQMAAMNHMGNVSARCQLGAMEGLNGNHDRSLRHFMIAARCGHDGSLEMIKKAYMEGDVTKEDFERVLREHKASQDETKSDQRDRARRQQEGGNAERAAKALKGFQFQWQISLFYLHDYTPNRTSRRGRQNEKRTPQAARQEEAAGREAAATLTQVGGFDSATIGLDPSFARGVE